MEATDLSRSRSDAQLKPSLRGTVTAWSAGLFVLLQLSVPLLIMARADVSSRDFSWDMFSYQLSCDQLAVIVRVGSGDWESVPLDRDLSSWAQLRRLLSPTRFPAYARKLCSDMARERGGPVQLHVWSRCQSDRDGASFSILDPDRNYCAPQ